ncbi:MAG: 3'-5' exonuclease [Phycisphaerales bacterium]|nr:3'-5' exonuclease [Phycisphaerales bacterium]
MESYLVFDFETSGLNPQSDRIIQVGFCQVEDGQVIGQGGWLINQAVRMCREAIALHGITPEKLREQGIDPRDSLTRFLEMIGNAPACIGHNIHMFDVLFLNAEAKRLGLAMPSTHDFADTAALFKGWKMGVSKSSRESHRDYAQRVLSMRVPGLKYAIPACVKSLGIKADMSGAHVACHDAYLTHLIYQRLQRLVSG